MASLGGSDNRSEMLVRRVACSRLSPTRQPCLLDRAKVFSRQASQCLVDSERCIGCVLLSTANSLVHVLKLQVGERKPAQTLSSRVIDTSASRRRSTPLRPDRRVISPNWLLVVCLLGRLRRGPARRHHASTTSFAATEP